MDLKETIENYKTLTNEELYLTLTFLKDRFESDKKRVVEITHQIDAIEKDYHLLYGEYKKRLNG